MTTWAFRGIASLERERDGWGDYPVDWSVRTTVRRPGPNTMAANVKLAALWVLALSIVSCNGGSFPDDPYSRAAAGLCDASAEVKEGNVDQARLAFYDASHRPLHDLATEVAGVDRGLAGRMLEAKESVESALDNPTTGLSESFEDLLRAVDNALTATGHIPIPCVTGGS